MGWILEGEIEMSWCLDIDESRWRWRFGFIDGDLKGRSIVCARSQRVEGIFQVGFDN